MDKVIINVTKISNGYVASAHFTYLTKHAETQDEAVRYFVQELKLRNYEVNVKN